MNTLDAARRLLARRFEEAGLDSPALDARLLVGHALSLDHAALISQGRSPLTDAQRAAIARVCEQRLAGEPVARILGCREFWGLPLGLSQATLVPRPETETVVEVALEALAARRDEPLRIADLGTGSGAILLALLHELPGATGIGTDLSDEALDTARANARALGLDGRAQFVRADFGEGLTPPFDLVVSNPPYIPTRDIAALAGEVRDHDPPLALDGGADGLAAYRAIAAQLPGLLADGGVAVLEIGIGQAQAVSAILEAAGLAAAAVTADLNGIERVLRTRTAPMGSKISLGLSPRND